MPTPHDIAAATELVDYALDRIGASETYRALHRDRMIRNELPFQQFVRETKAAKAVDGHKQRRAA
jgi:hypothetical protein